MSKSHKTRLFVDRLARKLLKPAVYFLSNPARLFDREFIAYSGGIGFHCAAENLIERTIAETGTWEPWETQIVRTHVKAGDIVFDIGANIGYFTLLMSALVGEAGRVYAFEPTKFGIDRLRKNLELNKQLPRNVVLQKSAVSARSGQRTERLEARFSSRVASHSDAEEITFSAFDDISLEFGIDRIDFLKIDIDGHDLDAMKSGYAALTRFKPLVLAEINGPALAAEDSSSEEYLQYFDELGYSEFMDSKRDDWQNLAELLRQAKFLETQSINILLRSTGEIPSPSA